MGIEVDVGGVRGTGGDACGLARQLRAARSGWDAATRDGWSACGLPVAREAFRTLQNTWFTEVGAHATVLDQLRTALPDYAGPSPRTGEAAASRPVADGGQ